MTFEEFAVARLPAVLRFAGVLTGDRALAEDVVQEVLVRAYLRWEHIARMSLPELYVRKMVVNEFLSWRRRSWRTVPAGPGADFPVQAAPDHAAEHAVRVDALAQMRERARQFVRRAQRQVVHDQHIRIERAQRAGNHFRAQRDKVLI